MATSGSTRVNVTSNGYIYLTFEWSTESQSVQNNTSTINWKLKLTSAGYGANINASQPKACKVVVNGVTVTDTTVNVSISAGASKTLASGKATIQHNADGSKAFSYSFSQVFDINYSGVQIGTKSGQGNGTLNTIPRATTPTLPSSAEFGQTITIQTPRASSAFNHTLQWKLGTSNGTIATNVATSTTWTIPNALMNQIPNSLSAGVSIICLTYNGGVLVGSKTVTLTTNVPSSIVPSIDSVTFTDGTSGVHEKFNTFIKDHSKLSATITRSGTYGSTIISTSSEFQGTTYKGTEWISGLIETSGTLSVKTTVTDSRGRKKTVTNNISVLDYYSPQVVKFEAQRSNSNGEVQDDGTCLKIDLQLDICALNNLNDKSYTVDYRDSSATNYTTIETGSTYTLTKTIITGAIAELDNAYRVRLRVSDFFSSDIEMEVEIPTSFSLMDFNVSGKGMAIGQASVDDTFTVAIPSKLKQEEKQTPTLLNNWTDYNPDTYEPCYFYKDSCGRVHLSGMVAGGTTTAGTGLFTLPEGYRPAKTEIFLCITASSTGSIRVDPNGNVILRSGANATWTSISGISFQSI